MLNKIVATPQILGVVDGGERKEGEMKNLEATPGIEPGYTVLQTVA